MKSLSKTSGNLRKVADSICAIDFSRGKFTLSRIYDDSVHLVSKGRNGIGGSILSMIPSNWWYRVSFEDNCLHLRIFIG